MKNFRRIGVLTSGGDAPGMNAAIRGVTRAALSAGVEVMGIYRGYSGLISGDIRPLAVRDVSNIINKGGTMLYSDRCPEFATEAGMQQAVETCHRFGIDGIVAIGGDGTFRGAIDLTVHGIPCVGLPGTIDNDITSTENTIGYDTAMNTVIEMVDKLRDTCESHARCSVIEVMGRGAGDIALNTAIASGATAVAIPEFPFDEEALFARMHDSRKLGKRNFIIIVSEALGSDYGEGLCCRIVARTGIEARFARLAHIVRGGSPSLRDRVLSTRMGICAVDELLQGHSNLVICERNGSVQAVDIHYALTLDAMYKGKIKEEQLASFDEQTVACMRAEVDARRRSMAELYAVANRVNL